MRKTKLMALLMASVMLFATACGKDDSGSKDPTNAPTPTDAAGTESTPVPTAAGDETPTTPPASGEEITLTFASWALGTEEENNLERRLIAEYEAANPGVKIKIADDIVSAGNWTEALTTAAAGGSLPDVVLIGNLPTAVANEWAYDVTSLVAADEEWNNIPSMLRESVSYGNKQYGIPSAMHLAGYFINTDLFESENVTPLEYGYTLEEWEKAVADMSTPSKGIVALKNSDFVDWYPYIKNPELGWFTYDGEQVHLNDASFIDAVKYSLLLNKSGYAFNGLTDEQKSNFGVATDWEAWNAGNIAFAYDASYACNSLATERSFTSKFIGLPGGKSVIIPDYQFIGKTTAHPEQAYDFAKYMSFGKAGILKRLEIVEANEGVNYVALPLNTDQEILDKYFANFPVEGVKTAYENMEGNTIVEAYKFTPGYTNARWDALTGVKIGDVENAKIAEVINACMLGVLNIDDYAEQLNKLANQYISEEAAIVKSVTN